MTTKPDLAVAQLGRLIAAGLPAGWAASGEVYTRSGKLRQACETAGLAYVGIVPCDFAITLACGAVIRADQAIRDAAFERRSCGTGTKGPRLADRALAGTASPRLGASVSAGRQRARECDHLGHPRRSAGGHEHWLLSGRRPGRGLFACGTTAAGQGWRHGIL